MVVAVNSMKRLEDAFNFIDTTKTLQTVEALTEAFQGLISRFGFAHFRAGDCTTPKLHVEERPAVSTWPVEWAERWVSKNYISIDPVVSEAASNNQTFIWHDVRARAPKIGARVMDEGRDFRLNDGFGFGVHKSNGRSSAVIAACEHYELTPREEACLHLAGLYFLSRLEQLQPPVMDKKVHLTSREKECLSWVAAGKSDWEISVILGISESTARWYVVRAMEKLEVRTRPQAVAVGLVRNLISL
jgi:LuxR family quorum sensing-dependent transcriptional regulator